MSITSYILNCVSSFDNQTESQDSGIRIKLFISSLVNIKTHDSESRGQEEAQQRDR